MKYRVNMAQDGVRSLSDQFQKTIKRRIHCTGTGLHSGETVKMTLKPAPANTGVVFRRTDVEAEKATIVASYETMLGTTISNSHGVKVQTIEHLMAALAGTGVDNVIVEINGLEVPVVDGSSSPFVFLIDNAGLVSQAEPKRRIRILKPVIVEEGEKLGEFTPGHGFTVALGIDFDCPVIAQQDYRFSLNGDGFRNEISSARTFGYLKDVEQLQALGLARGGSLDNTIVIDGDVVMNDGGLRYDDEFVRHKVLDAIGDLFLAGMPIEGTFRGVRSGHDMNNKLLRALFAQPDAWEIVEDTPAVSVRTVVSTGKVGEELVSA